MFPYNNLPRYVTLSVKQSIKMIVNGGAVNIVIRNNNNNLNRHNIYCRRVRYYIKVYKSRNCYSLKILLLLLLLQLRSKLQQHSLPFQ